MKIKKHRLNNSDQKKLKEISAEQDVKQQTLILGPQDRPKSKLTWVMFSIQHIFAMFGATVLMPILVNSTVGAAWGVGSANVIGTDLAMFASGIGTLIYIACTAGKVPIYLGSSIAYITTVASMYSIYGSSAFFGLLGVGLVYLMVALLIYFFGVKWLKKILSPIIVGPMIMIIGLSLAPIAINAIGLGGANKTTDWWGVGVGVITLLSGMLIALLFRGKAKLMPILGAIVTGFMVALIVSTWHKDFINYSTFKEHGKDWRTYFGVPNFHNAIIAGHNPSGITGVIQADGVPIPIIIHPGTQNAVEVNNHLIDFKSLNINQINTVTAAAVKAKEFTSFGKWSAWPFLLMMPIAFVTISEHIGDHTVLSRITNRDYLTNPGLHRTLIGDGLATMAGGFIGGPPNTSYGENTTVVGMSRIGSTYITGLAAVFAIIVSFFKFLKRTVTTRQLYSINRT